MENRVTRPRLPSAEKDPSRKERVDLTQLTPGNQEEDLHCLIMADTEEKVNKAKKLIHNVIETVRDPEGSCPTISPG